MSHNHEGMQRCKRCGGIKSIEQFHTDAQGRVGKTCIKCKAANARNAQIARARKLEEERPKNTLPVNSGLSEEQLDERLAAAVKKATSSHNMSWTLRY